MWLSKLEFALWRKGIHFSLTCLSAHGPIKTLTLPNYLSLFHLSFPRLLYLFISQADVDSPLLSPMSSRLSNPYESILSIPLYFFFRTLPFLVCPNYLSFWVNYISSYLSLADGWQIVAHPHPVFTWDKRARKWRPRQRGSRRRYIDGKIKYVCLLMFQRCGWRGLIWLNS